MILESQLKSEGLLGEGAGQTCGHCSEAEGIFLMEVLSLCTEVLN